jgi:hypothetical protein
MTTINKIAENYNNANDEEKKNIINELIVKLEELNKKYDNSNIVNDIFEGIEDYRDNIIDIILWDNDLISFIERYNKKYKNWYYKMYGDVDFTEIIHKLLRIILKTLKFHEEVRSPLGYIINKCFIPKTLSNGEVVLSYLDSYFNRYKDKFPELVITTSIDAMQEYQMNDNSDINEDVLYMEELMDNRDRRDGLNKKKYKEFVEYDKLEVKKINNNGRMLDLDISEEDREIQNEILEKDEDEFIINDIGNGFISNNIISNFSISYDKFKLKNFNKKDKENNWNEKDIQEEFNKKLNTIMWHWNIYKKNIGYIPDDIFKLKRESYIHYKYKNIDINLFVNCPIKTFEFDLVLKENSVNDYIKNMIIKNLSKREALLIGLMYYEMKSQQDIMEILEYDYRDINNFNKFKHKALKKLKIALLNDYDYIAEEYGYTYLLYWLRKTINKIKSVKKS